MDKYEFTMETLKTDAPKLPDMVMCGDHPSVTKTELNAKETRTAEKEKDKERKTVMSNTRISPTTSRTEAARARPRSLEAVRGAGRPDLVQAALGSFRWPPYLLAVWVVVVVLTHALHCAAAMLERALPAVRQLCHYFRSRTETSWASEATGGRVRPLLLALATGLMYAVYCVLLAAHALALWAVEPLCGDTDIEDMPKVTDYPDEGVSFNIVSKPSQPS